MKQWRGNLALLLAALIWGFAFVAQSSGMEHMGPFTFQSVRSLLGGISLLPVLAVRTMQRKQKAPQQSRKTLLLGGLCCGASPVRRVVSAADWNSIYHSGKGGVHHLNVCAFGAASGIVFS